MKKRMTLLMSLLVTVLIANAQYKTVNFQYERNWFNGNAPIPSQTYFKLNGNINKNIERVEFDVYKSKKVDKKRPTYQSTWNRGLNGNATQFVIPVDIKLKENSHYSFVIRYFTPLSDIERSELKYKLNAVVENYLKANITLRKNKIKLSKSTSKMYDELNQIIHTGLTYYRLQNGLDFDSFSSIVKEKLNQLKSLRVEGYDDFSDKMNELFVTCNTEVNSVLSTDILKMVDKKTVLNYPTENKPTSLRLNIGYGAIYKDGKIDDMNYAKAPYAGISLPFGDSRMNDNFWSRSSLSLGVFLQNFKFSDDSERMHSPVIGLPVYVAYGIKPFSFMRINIGATTYQKEDYDTFQFKNLMLRPFIGVAFELDVTAKFVK